MPVCRKLVVIANQRQFDACQQTWSDSTWPAVYDHDLIHAFRGQGQPFANLWDFIDQPTADENDELAWTLCDRLGSFNTGLPEIVTNLAERCQDDYAFPIRFALNTATTVGRCIDALKPDVVAVFSENREAFNWDPADPPPDIFNAVVRWCAEERNLSVELLTLPDMGRRDGVADQTTMGRFPHPVESKADLLMLANFLSVTERELLVRSESIKKYATINICDRASVPYMPEQLLDMLPFHARIQKNSTASAVQEHMAGFSGKDARCVTHNIHLLFLWEHVLRRLGNGERCYRAGRFMARASGAKLALLGYSVMGYMRCLREGLMAEGCHTLSINHSGIGRYDSWKRHRGDRGPLAVWGSWEKEVLARFRRSSETMHVTGSLRRDIQAMMSAHPVTPDMSQRPRVVILTGRITHLYAAAADVNAHWQMWDAVLALIHRHPEWDFVIKPHPRYDHVPVYESPKFKAAANLTIFKGAIADILPGTSVAIAFNNMTTGCLEPMARDIPLIAIENAIRTNDRDQLEEGAIAVSSIDQLESALSQMLLDSDARRERIARGKKFLHRVVHASGDNAVDNYIRLMDNELDQVPARKICAASSWLLRMLLSVQHVMAGGQPQKPSSLFTELKKAGRGMAFNLHELFDMHQLGECLLSIAVWGPWPKPEQRNMPSIRRLLTWVYRAQPKTIRPSWRVYRRYLVEACRRDIRNAKDEGESVFFDRILLSLIAPKSIVRS